MRKYVFANVKLPIEIFSDGDYHIYTDRIVMNFESCPNLPPISEYKQEDIMRIIQEVLNSEKEIQEYEIDEEEPFIKIKKQPEHIPETETNQQIIPYKTTSETQSQNTDIIVLKLNKKIEKNRTNLTMRKYNKPKIHESYTRKKYN